MNNKKYSLKKDVTNEDWIQGISFLQDTFLTFLKLFNKFYEN